MSEERALTATHSALAVYGQGEDIKTLGKRIQMCLPGGDKLTVPEALALAQLAVAYELNPFNGEVWAIKDKNGNFRGTMVGVKGLRKAARKISNYWTRQELMAEDDKRAAGIDPNAIAYRTELYRTDLMMDAARAIKMLFEAGMKDAAERFAYAPFVGVGFCRLGEPTKMAPDQAARKRSEADAIKQAFDLPFGTETSANGERIGYVDAEWSDVTAPTTAEERQAQLEHNTTLLHGDHNESDPLGLDAERAGPDWASVPDQDAEPEAEPQIKTTWTTEATRKATERLLMKVQESTAHYTHTNHLFAAMKELHGDTFTWGNPNDKSLWDSYAAELVLRVQE